MSSSEHKNHQRTYFRSDFTKGQTLVFDEQALADDFDNAAAKYYEGNKDLSKLLADFRNVTYLDLAVLINFTALFLRRRENNQETFIGISKNKRVRDFIRVWRFPEAFFEATATRFETILVQDDQHYRGEKQDTYTGVGSGIEALEFDSEWTNGSQTKRNFFEFTSFNLVREQAESFSTIPRGEGSRWNKVLIRQVLTTHLDGDNQSDEVARVVIYESLSNAVRHPNATIIQTVSKFDWHEKPDELTSSRSEKPSVSTTGRSLRGHLRIYIWDDGESIVDTLLPTVRVGGPLRGVKLPNYMYDSIHLDIRDAANKRMSLLRVSQMEDPPPDASEELILLCSLFPGVTRSLRRLVQPVQPFDTVTPDAAPIELADKQGMGLYALTRTALDLYQGSLLIRSGNHRLVMEVAHDSYRVQHNVTYKAKITRYPESFPKFRGNLLGIMLPIRMVAREDVTTNINDD